jgi:molecular chaperone DnaJ
MTVTSEFPNGKVYTLSGAYQVGEPSAKGDDGTIELEFEPGTQPGHVRVLRGRGMPVLQGFGRGDHRVLVNVLVPHRLTDEQRRTLEEFDRLSGDDTYRPDEGFFDRLKSAFR